MRLSVSEGMVYRTKQEFVYWDPAPGDLAVRVGAG